ncbi:MAG TPA: hypothetical protein VKP89_04345 [Burkholderiales bacterium]|nr:hypothetical protein [Burkholderiales bacterium]
MKRFLVVATLAAACGAAQAQEPALKDDAGLRWVCGGIGAEEREALAGLEPQVNLKLLFVTGKRGAFVANVDVSLYDGASELLRFTMIAQGPICLIQAPAGRYRITATYEALRLERTVALPEKKAKDPVRIVFSFPERSSTGDTQ